MGAYENWKNLKKFLEEKVKDYEKSDMTVHTYSIILDTMEELDGEAENEMNETIAMCYYDVFNKKPSIEDAIGIRDGLSEDIRQQADQWNWDDTEVRDLVHEWISDNWD